MSMKAQASSSELGNAVIEAVETIDHCVVCRNFSETPKCHVVTQRDQKLICVVETPSDLMSVEESMIFNGRYFVLMGRIFLY